MDSLLGKVLSRVHRLILRDPQNDPRSPEYLGAWVDVVRWAPLKLAYVTVPKTANTTVKTVLSLMCSTLANEELEILRRDAQAIHGILRAKPDNAVPVEAPAMLYGYKVFATVRHPTTRFVSFYKDKIRGEGWSPDARARIFNAYGFSAKDSLRECVDKICDVTDEYSEIHFRSQCDILHRSTGQFPEAIFKMEDFDQLWNWLAEQVKPHGYSLPSQPQKINATSNENVGIDQETEEKLFTRYRSDYDKFGYTPFFKKKCPSIASLHRSIFSDKPELRLGSIVRLCKTPMYL